MKSVADVIGVARSNLAERAKQRERKAIGRPPQPDADLIAEIKAVIANLPTYGYRRVHAILRRRALAEGRPPPNHKRVYGAMKRHGLLLQRHAGGAERRHDGRIAVSEPNLRWCSDGFEVACDNGERVRIAFALDCCDREAMSFVATTAGSAATRFATSWWQPSSIASAASTDCPTRSSGSATTAPATSPTRHVASLATSASSQRQRLS